MPGSIQKLFRQFASVDVPILTICFLNSTNFFLFSSNMPSSIDGSVPSCLSIVDGSLAPPTTKKIEKKLKENIQLYKQQRNGFCLRGLQ